MAWAEKRGPHSWRVRYRKDDGGFGTITGFTSKKAAEAKADEIEADQRRGTFLDPDAGKLTLAEWSVTWFDALDVAATTTAQYRSLARNHILPRWGTTRLDAISGLAVHTWAKKLRADGYAVATVTTITKIMSMMLADAADERLIPANPIRPRRRGRRRHQPRTERLWATPEQALAIAAQAAALVGTWAAVLIITAAWTGARWGELAGLRRVHTHLDDGVIVIDPDTGALHEVDGRLELGPPKTAESARTITLPPFLVDLLRVHLDSHDHPHVFVTAEGELLRRSNFARRAMRPATDGNLHRTRPRVRVAPIVPGLVFHGFRHSHKTWMIADGIPDVAQARRLGHTIPDKIQDIYSHVAAEVETRLIDALQRRWTTALATLSTSDGGTGNISELALPGAPTSDRRATA
ncbi:tyrosine-type recombinase/integrase [Gandjariella thermophila]|uniref:DMT family permease n=1 Tax=Gandjariella thermophila TaxID=1931992 RepID=A0A4D4JDV0_9PSEU|nr:site-specific integrase [Gandjariella thermophila]GDY33592.1 DMT family permease [Gandjariella thermophila]